MRIHRYVVVCALAIATASIGASAALAQAPEHARVQVPEVASTTAGSIARYILGPGGHVRGFVLDNGAIVFVHGAGAESLATAAPLGTQVRVEGLAPASTPTVIHRATVVDTGNRVLIAAPAGTMGFRMRDPAHRGEHMAHLAQLPTRSTQSAVQVIVPGPRGGVRALLLADGTSVFLHGRMIREVTQHGVRVGDTLQISGRGAVTPLGSGMLAERVTFADGASVDAPIPAAPTAPTM